MRATIPTLMALTAVIAMAPPASAAIYRVGGGVAIFRTEAKFHFYDVGYEYGGSYWKVHDPLSMEIWNLDERRRPLARVRKGPKVFYCSNYDRQWVNVSGLRGCFAFVMRVDPKNLLYESNENNNRSTRIIRLPYRPGPQHC